MSTLKLLVDEETRKLVDYNNTPVFVIKDTNVNTVRFAISSGFSDIELTEDTAFRVMYIPPGIDRTVKTKTLTFAENNGDYLYYDWEAPPSVFEKTGILTIALCILKNGDEVQGWHTVPYQIYIYNTLHTDDSDAGDETITPTLAERVALLEAIVQWGRPTGTFLVSTEPTEYTTQVDDYIPAYRIPLELVLNQTNASEIVPGDILEYGFYHYPVGHVDETYIYLGPRQSIRGESGAQGATGPAGKDAILLRIDSSRGTAFKNNQVSTVLSVTIFYGSMKIENINALRDAFGPVAHLEWEWLRLNDEAYGTISSSDSRLINDGFGLVLTPDDVDVKVTFRCNLVL